MLKRHVLLLALAFISQAGLWAASPATYKIKSHEISMEGTSNLHGWTASVEKATGTFSFTVDNGAIISLQEASLRFDAESIKGSEGRRMDVKIYEALDTSKNPSISFAMREVTSLTGTAGRYNIGVRGVLTVAGVPRVVDLTTSGRLLPNGDLEFSGNHKVKMTDHKVSPPTAMLGAMRTGDEVNLKFKVILQAQ
jgi:polyisoprenoid-binding protein YceI